MNTKKTAFYLSISSVLFASLFGISFALSVNNSEDVFLDTPSTHPQYKEIHELKKLGIISGYEDGTFRPDNDINRVEALKLAFEVSGLNLIPGVAPASFLDIEEIAWYTPYLNLAVYKEIAQGYPDMTFRPNQPVNKVEFLKFLLLAQNVDFSGSEQNKVAFADTMPGMWYTKYVDFAKHHSLIDPDSNNKIFPARYLTRAEVASIIYRFRQIDFKKNSDSKTVVEGKPIISNKNYAIFFSDSFKFSVEYPKVWFYAGSASNTEGVIREYRFGPKDLSENPPVLIMELLPLSFNFTENSKTEDEIAYGYELKENEVILTRRIEGNRVYRLKGDEKYFSQMLKMLLSISLDVEAEKSYNSAEKSLKQDEVSKQKEEINEKETDLTELSELDFADELPPQN